MMMSKKRIGIILAVILLAITLIVIVNIYNTSREDEISVFDRIERSWCAKFECCTDNSEPILINNEIVLLSNSIPALEKSDKDIGEPLYRITFNCKEITVRGIEIEVIVGKNAISIDGVVYSVPEGVLYKDVIDLFKMKYKYFSGK